MDGAKGDLGVTESMTPFDVMRVGQTGMGVLNQKGGIWVGKNGAPYPSWSIKGSGTMPRAVRAEELGAC